MIAMISHGPSQPGKMQPEDGSTFYLIGIAGPLEGARIPLEGNSIGIGRSPENAIVIDSPNVSRQHCQFLRSDGSIRLIDAGSSNGTFVNGRPVQERELVAGDRIGVGPCVFVLALER